MAKDYYNILGVDKKASPDEIKKAFRKHAQKYHPDKPSGDEAKFKEVNEAYSVLSNDKKRAQYDQFGQTFSDSGAGGFGGQGAGGFSGFEGFDFSQFTQGFGGQGGAGGQQFEFDLGDIFGSVFGGGGRQRRRKGRDIQVDVTITFKESIFGVQKKIQFQRQSDRSKENFEITIPQGIDSGEMLRVRGKGEPTTDGDPGDLYVRIHVTPHSHLHKEGYHLVMDLGIKLTEAILGTKKEIETLDGNVTLKIPAGVTHGELLRIKGKGVPIPARGSGDLLVRILIPIPEKISGKAKNLIEELQREGY